MTRLIDPCSSSSFSLHMASSADAPPPARSPELLSELTRKQAGLVLFLGPRGSGKTLALAQLQQRLSLASAPPLQHDPRRALVSMLSGSPAERMHLLATSGLSTLPSYLTPLQFLSGGEAARLHAARTLREAGRRGRGCILDDLGSCLDITSAQVLAACLRRTVTELGLHNVLVATSIEVLVPWLQPDLVVLLPSQRLLHNPTRLNERRPRISLTWDLGTPDLDNAFPAKADRRLRQEQPFELGKPLCVESTVAQDQHTAFAAESLDYDGTISHSFAQPPPLEGKKPNWRLGVIAGPSGSGKSVTLRKLTQQAAPVAWPADESVVAFLNCFATSRSVKERLSVCGLKERHWSRPYATLSSGEQESAQPQGVSERRYGQQACVATTAIARALRRARMVEPPLALRCQLTRVLSSLHNCRLEGCGTQRPPLHSQRQRQLDSRRQYATDDGKSPYVGDAFEIFELYPQQLLQQVVGVATAHHFLAFSALAQRSHQHVQRREARLVVDSGAEELQRSDGSLVVEVVLNGG